MISPLTPNVRRYLGLEDPMDDPGTPTGVVPPVQQPYNPADDGYGSGYPTAVSPVQPVPPSPQHAPSAAPIMYPESGDTTWNGSDASSGGSPNPNQPVPANSAPRSQPSASRTTIEAPHSVLTESESTRSDPVQRALTLLDPGDTGVQHGPVYTPPTRIYEPPTQAEAEESAASAAQQGASAAHGTRNRFIRPGTSQTVVDASQQADRQMTDDEILARQGPLARGIDALGRWISPQPIVETRPEDRGLFMSDQPDEPGRLWEWRGRLAQGAADAIARGTGQDPERLVVDVTIKGVPLQLTISDLLEGFTDPLFAGGFGVGDMVISSAGKRILGILAPFTSGPAKAAITRALGETAGNAAITAAQEAGGRAVVGGGVGLVTGLATGQDASTIGGLTAGGATVAAGLPALKPVARAAGRALEPLGRELGERALSMAPRMIQETGGGGQRRPIEMTVEVLRDRIDVIRDARVSARARGDAKLDAELGELLNQHENDLIDAIAARQRLEPAIESDIGRRIERPMSPRAAEEPLDATHGFERVRPDQQASIGPVDDAPRGGSISLNAGMAGVPARGVLGAVTDTAAQSLSGGFSGAAAGAALDPEDPRRGAATGFGIGLLAGPAVVRGQRALVRRAGGNALEGGARIGLGDLPEPRYRPELSQEPVLPGMEPPPRPRGEIPNISDEPNRGRVLGDVPPSQVREPTFPGMDAPYVREQIPDVPDVPNRGRVLGDIPPSQINEPTLPGMEGPRRPYEQVGPLAQSDTPNRGRVLGDMPPSSIREPMLPGMEPQRTAGPIGEAADALALTPEQRTARASEALDQFPGARNWYERQRMRNERQAQQSGKQPLSAREWLMSLVGNVGYSSMLGPGTFSVNLMQGLWEPLWATVKEPVRGAVRAVQTGNTAALREAGSMQAGAIYGMTQLGEAVLDALMGRGAYAPNPNFPTLSQQTVDPLAKLIAQVVEAPGRVWSSLPDAVFGTIAKHAGEAREAAQIATNKGLKGAEWKAEQARLLADARAVAKGELPTGPEVQQVVDAGAAYANRQTYRDDLGTIGKGAENIAKLGKAPVLGTWASPFFKTIWTAGVRQAEKSPIGAVMNSQPTRFDKSYDALVGSAVVLGLGAYATRGGVTGSGPADPKEKELLREKGWQPYSTIVQLPGMEPMYVPNRMFGIFEGTLNAAGEVHDAAAYGKPEADGRARFDDAARRTGQLIRQNPYLFQGVVSILDAYNYGPIAAASDEAARMTPFGATGRTVGQMTDTMERTTDRGAGIDPVDEFIQRWQSQTGQRSDLPVAQDAFGQPKENQRRGPLALFPSMPRVKDAPEADIFRQARVFPGDPKKELRVTQSQSVPPMPLRPSERRLWDQKRGEILLDASREIARDPNWKDAPPDVKEKVLRRVLEMAGKAADDQVLESIDDAEITRRIDAEIAKKERKAS